LTLFYSPPLGPIVSRTALSASATIAAAISDIQVEVTALAADVVLTLPAPTKAGQVVRVVDGSGAVGTSYLIALKAANGHTLRVPNGGTGNVAIVSPYGAIVAVADGTSTWNVVAMPGSLGTPGTIPGCKLWLAADTGVTLNSTTVSSWADQSGNSNDVAQGTGANQPTFNSSNASFKNRPTLTFDGTNAFMSKASLTGMSSGDVAHTMAIVCTMNTGTSHDYSMLALSTATTFASIGHLNATTGFWFGGTGNGSPRFSWQDSARHAHVRTANGSAAGSGAASLGNCWVDGKLLALVDAGGTLALTNNGVVVGAHLLTAGTRGAGDIAEVAIWNRKLTDAEILDLTRYFLAKY
jgi:hypothetical protein